jgi:hypothetical protein
MNQRQPPLERHTNLSYKPNSAGINGTSANIVLRSLTVLHFDNISNVAGFDSSLTDI